MIRLLVFSTLAFMFFYAGSCSSYHVEGYISADKTEIIVNDTLFMEAIVTDEVQPSDVRWDLYPMDTDSEIICPLPDDPDKNRFNALFIAKDTGEYQIAIRFLYRNTAPKESDTLHIKVLPISDKQ